MSDPIRTETWSGVNLVLLKNEAIALTSPDNIVGILKFLPGDVYTVLGISTNSAAPRGLGYALFQFSLEDGRTIKSGNTFTPGGEHIWKQLALDDNYDVWCSTDTGKPEKVEVKNGELVSRVSGKSVYDEDDVSDFTPTSMFPSPSKDTMYLFVKRA